MPFGKLYCIATLAILAWGVFLACVAEGLVPRIAVPPRARHALSCAAGLLIVMGFGAIGFGLALRG